MKRLTLVSIISVFIFTSLLAAKDKSEENTVWYYHEKDPSLEIVHLRTSNTKVFLNEDGHVTYRVYLQSVHYTDEVGCLCDIEPDPGPEMKPRGMDFSGYADDLFGDVVTNDEIWTHEDGFWRGFAKFNTSAIPDTTTIDTVKLSLYALNCWGVLLGGPHDMRSMESNPQTGNGYSIFADAGNGDLYLDDFDPDPDVLYTWILGDEQTDPACVQMTNQLGANWFAIGMCDYGGGAWYSNAMGYDGGIGYLEIENPTAVALVSFTGSPDFDRIVLNWRTEFEANNLEWMVERKEKDGHYRIVTTIPGQNTKPGPTSYSFVDRNVTQGEGYYYRLTDISTSGETTVHEPLFIRTLTTEDGKILAVPTIFNDRVSITVRGMDGKNTTLSIFDESGRMVRAENLTGKESPLTIEWDGRDHSGKEVNTGIYFIRLVINGTETETKKVIFVK
jgi:hypothetical protein